VGVVAEEGRAGNRCACGFSVWSNGLAQGPLMRAWASSSAGVNEGSLAEVMLIYFS